MRPLIISGIGTNVGKTLASAIIVEALGAEYWKPIHAGTSEEYDACTIEKLTTSCKCHPEAYRVPATHNPQGWNIKRLFLPKTEKRLVIETCGGLMIPVAEKTLLSELFFEWNPLWILVSKNYLGSINHTLLSAGFLWQNGQTLLGIIFNGEEDLEKESFLQNYTSLPCLGKLFPETSLTKEKIQWYADRWKTSLEKTIASFGIPTDST